ncbi:MAG: peptide chain release factor 1, partial [Glaciecola sp.]
MKQSVVHKLESLVERFEEVQALLGDLSVIGNQDKFRNLSKEYSQLEAVVKQFGSYQTAQKDVESALEMLQESDPEIKEMAQEELKDSKARVEELEMSLQILLLPKDPKDDNSCFLEIRAGAGGDEAAIFAGDLFRMYSRYAETKGWKLELMSSNHGDHGGYKEIIVNVSGAGAYGVLKFES